MNGNIAVVTPQGLRFQSLDEHETKRLIQLVEELKAERDPDEQYLFFIEFEDGTEVKALDFWVAIGVSNGCSYC